MKKLVAFLLICTVVLGLGAVAFADDDEDIVLQIGTSNAYLMQKDIKVDIEITQNSGVNSIMFEYSYDPTYFETTTVPGSSKWIVTYADESKDLRPSAIDPVVVVEKDETTGLRTERTLISLNQGSTSTGTGVVASIYFSFTQDGLTKSQQEELIKWVGTTRDIFGSDSSLGSAHFQVVKTSDESGFGTGKVKAGGLNILAADPSKFNDLDPDTPGMVQHMAELPATPWEDGHPEMWFVLDPNDENNQDPTSDKFPGAVTYFLVDPTNAANVDKISPDAEDDPDTEEDEGKYKSFGPYDKDDIATWDNNDFKPQGDEFDDQGNVTAHHNMAWPSDYRDKGTEQEQQQWNQLPYDDQQEKIEERERFNKSLHYCIGNVDNSQVNGEDTINTLDLNLLDAYLNLEGETAMDNAIKNRTIALNSRNYTFYHVNSVITGGNYDSHAELSSAYWQNLGTALVENPTNPRAAQDNGVYYIAREYDNNDAVVYHDATVWAWVIAQTSNK